MIDGTYEHDGEFCNSPPIYRAVGSDILYQQRQKEMNEAFNYFKEVVNRSVLKPENYIGDANVCQLGPWVEDNVSSWGGGLRDLLKFYSGRRDLSNLAQSTREFVNKHGGWVTEDNNGSIIEKIEGNKIYLK